MMPDILIFPLSTIHYATIPIRHITHKPLLYNPFRGKQAFFGGNIEIFAKKTCGPAESVTSLVLFCCSGNKKILQGPPVEAK